MRESHHGSIAVNLHEGSRSEYLAQYVFSSFGTSIPVPHQEDNGLDLYCTVMERIGRNAWPRCYYAVQVKSTDDPWEFRGPESVKWLVEFPFPIFLCVVSKSSARLRLYLTSPRFFAWAHPPLPENLVLIPGEGNFGQCIQWDGGESFSLQAPIADFSVQEILDNDFHSRIRQVVEFWAKNDNRNVYHVRTGVRRFAMPVSYRTNEIPLQTEFIQGKTTVAEDDLQLMKDQIKNQLIELSEQLFRGGDMAGATRGALLMRYLFPEDTFSEFRLMHLLMALNEILGLQGQPSQAHRGISHADLVAGLDGASRLIDEYLRGEPGSQQ
jgi:hypothetical protein